MAAPISLAQSLSGNSATGQPRIVLPGVRAGNTLLYLVVSQSSDPLMLPTDNFGNPWACALSATDGAKNQAIGLYYAPGVLGGSTTITCPSITQCAWAAHEFANIQVNPDPFDNCGMAATTTTSLVIPYIFTIKNELVFAFAVSSANIAIGLPAGVAASQTVQSINGSLVTSWSNAPGAATGTYTWTTPQASQIGAGFLTLL